MNELAQLVPNDIDFSILESLFKALEPAEISFVLGMIIGPALAMWLFNKRARKDHGALSVYVQCFGRVALDIGLVAGIAGSAIGVVAMTTTFNANSNVEAAVSIALLTMLWGGIFVGLGYFLHNYVFFPPRSPLSEALIEEIKTFLFRWIKQHTFSHAKYLGFLMGP